MSIMQSKSSPTGLQNVSRRGILTAGAAFAAVATGLPLPGATAAAIEKVVKNGNIRQSVSRWCYSKIPLEKFCEICKKLGLVGIDLLNPDELPTVKKHGLIGTMLFSHSLTEGLAHTKNHAECLSKLRQSIDAASEFGFANVVCFPGNRYGIAEEDGIKNTVEGLKKIIGHAEEKNVTLCMEYLNSKVDHKDYMFDNMGFGVEVCKQVGSKNCKILYDIYHAQIMEGDIIRTIQDYHEYIAHYHTGGVPGRNEIDESQELYYPAIMRAILKTGFGGYVAHEFVPKAPDPVKSLAQAIEICDV
ncbi:MAG: sugar phosphate isomerase/epimerase [Sedimentisphaerales bacterium]|nr:sugar phosphate isomerase/epimerase [Sedimentisphaerales bacterium]